MSFSQSNRLRILFIAAEAAPLVKIGGLGDYIESLPKALLDQNKDAGITLDIRIAIPYTNLIHPTFLSKSNVLSFTSQHGSAINSFDIYTTTIDSIQYYVLKNKALSEQEQEVYSIDPVQDGEKFIAFSCACFDLMKAVKWQADIIHTNDWQTGPACNYLASHKKSNNSIRSIFVIHNLPYMGAGTQALMEKYGFQTKEDPLLPAWANNLPLVAGIQDADQVITVSPTYAQEIQTAAFGNDLQDYLTSQKHRIRGILNGIDQTIWDPKTDPLIQHNFNSDTLENRKKNKNEITAELALQSKPEIPLLVMISRLDRQKGIALLIETLKTLGKQHWQAVILGTGSADQEKLTRKLAKQFPKKVRVLNRFDNQFSHQLFAGGDIFLMPSLYEPCGTSQMIAMRYGCIPVAHAVGGLVDSICDTEESRTGFLFYKPEVKPFAKTLQHALQQFQNPVEWSKIQKRAMQQDFSWKNSAKEYLEVYRTIKRT
ncbi:MAG TPA: hypothetical protein DCK95_02015 [Anaerolineaceae bacterium]|uniref:Glycogen synthase n=1 Tax=Anaerolinea thermophila TaxID=167964 RepID=A0A117LH85_9CHLR|nr:MAG: Glycogen synthase [Anaerolinea thermophila]HAF61082.1 hypothetical protein [Anaerolineaceae bacterium]